MDILFIVFIVLILVSLRPAKIGEQYSDDYLSLENTGNLRGIMAVSIVLHHISEHTLQSNRIFSFMNHFGYLFVAVFFLLSGYGLMFSFSKKGTSYLKSFWKKKVLFFVLILIVNKIIYMLVDYFRGEERLFSAKSVLKEFFIGSWAKGTAWYLIVLILFYIGFWIIAKFSNSIAQISLFAFLYVLAVDLLLLSTGKGGIWIISNFSFPIGIFLACYSKKIDEILLRFYWLTVIIVGLIFVAFSVIPLRIASSYVICRTISAPMFSILVIVALRKIKIISPIWKFLNTISFEIFLSHAAVYELLRSPVVYIKNDVLWTVLTLLITVIVSFGLKYFNNLLHKLVS